TILGFRSKILCNNCRLSPIASGSRSLFKLISSDFRETSSARR
ncbi:18644_t:CDS:1, partial [Dentiscutata erythropus]